MKAQFYLVGGAVRDKLMGKESNDLDYTVEADSYQAMRDAIIERGGEIFLEQEKFLTIRAKVPNLGASDFVLARKDGTYTVDGRRPDSVTPGTLQDDLARRDFTVNAMARNENNNLIDPFGGLQDLDSRILRCVGDTKKRMAEDSLRMLRAIRFVITKGFRFDYDLEMFLKRQENAELLANISIERIREELLKCFASNTLLTMGILVNMFPFIGRHIFSRNIKLTPTIFVQ